LRKKGASLAPAARYTFSDRNHAGRPEESLEPASPLSFAAYPLVVAAFHFAIAAGVTVHTLIHKRDVSSAIAWIGVAWLAPFAGALLYAGFGVNRVRRRARKLRAPHLPAETTGAGDPASADPLDCLKIALGRITGQEIAEGRVVAILDSGDHGYPQMLAAIDSAESSISLCTFIFRADELGKQFIAALGRAHRRGVNVRVLIDGFGGGFLLSPSYHLLRRQGVPAARFLHSLLPWQMPYLDLRLHKKCLVIDGSVAFVGGLNIGAENLVANHPKSAVRDCHFRLEGTIVRQIEQQFDEDWLFTTREPPPARMPPKLSESGAPARAIVTGPDQEAERLVLTLLCAIAAARKSIRIATPYFVPDEQLVTALQLAALRGVAVDIVLPARNNHRLVGWATPPHVRPLLVAGCNLWLSPPPFDHSKLATIDDLWSLIGSANWDMRSLRLNFEMTVEVYDPLFASALAARIDTRCVQRLTLADIDQRPFVYKLRDAAARLTMPYI
jgi:cardiolipin synthase A/B